MQVSPEPQLDKEYNIRLKQLGGDKQSNLFIGSIMAQEKLFYNIELALEVWRSTTSTIGMLAQSLNQLRDQH